MAISIKVSRDKLIAALEAKLKLFKKQDADAKKAYDKYQERLKAFLDKIKINILSGYIDIRIESPYAHHISINFLDGDTKFVDSRPIDPGVKVNKHATAISDIENALALLKMSTQTEISTSNYKDVIQYI